MGWLRNISLDLRQSPLISDSVSCTFFPGLDPLTEEKPYDVLSIGRLQENSITTNITRNVISEYLPQYFSMLHTGQYKGIKRVTWLEIGGCSCDKQQAHS